MPTSYRRYAASTPERFTLPRLEIDVTHRPRHHGVTHRRACTDYDYHRRHRCHRDHRGYHTAARVASYGYDSDYCTDYGSLDDDFDTARVRLYTHDSHDPYSCTCYPRVSSKTIPSMMYDGVRCPHPEHRYQPVGILTSQRSLLLDLVTAGRYTNALHCYHQTNSESSWIPASSPSRGGEAAVYVLDIKQPSLPTPFSSVLVSVSVFMALSTVFHSINSPDNSRLSHSVLPVLILPHWSFQLCISS